jgi:ATP-dependent DNA ligase
VTKKFPRLYKATAKEGVQIWDIWVEAGGLGQGIICTRFGLENGKQQTVSEVITEGKNVGKKNETSAWEQACAEAESAWTRKKDRKGYGLDVGASAAVRSVSPMLAQVYEKHKKKVSWDTAFAQPKLDGFRCLARMDGRKVELISREGGTFTAPGHIREALGDLGLPLVTLDGELYCHGMSLNQISSACNRKSAMTDKLVYHVYDTIDAEQSFEHRYRFIRGLLNEDRSGTLHCVRTVKVRSESELLLCQSEFLTAGYEGAMLRYGSGGYEAGKRSMALLKAKTFQDGEFEVVDYKFGKGSYAAIPVFVCRTEDGNFFDVTAPGTLEEKQELGKRAADLLGKKLTVKFAYMTKTLEPVPYQPVAKGFRE